LKLALSWDERLDFVLAEDMSLKRLRVGDALLNELDDGDLEPAARMDAELAILALQMRELIARLDATFGLVGDEDATGMAAPLPRTEPVTARVAPASAEPPPWVE
jgi:recombination associated protein RdgC